MLPQLDKPESQPTDNRSISRKAGCCLCVEQTDSPLGFITVAGNDEAVHLVEFSEPARLEKSFASLATHGGFEWKSGSSKMTLKMIAELRAYFQGKLQVFQTPLCHPGTPFQEKVWAALAGIPYGQTLSYGELARRLGQPNSARAVARAVGQNRLAIVLPCHRIVGAGGSLTGYSGGLPRKRHLLELENHRSTQ